MVTKVGAQITESVSLDKFPPGNKKYSSRNFLFLQGHPSRFWGQLADGLTVDGHSVCKVHFCLSDLVFWGWRRGNSFRGKFSDWGAWISKFMSERNITDVIYYADRFPYHKAALKNARALGIKVWVIEFGYLRPDWLTLEPEGMGAFSNFPRSRVAIQKLAKGRIKPDLNGEYSHGFAIEAWNEVLFDLIQFFGRPLYPYYRSDRMYWPWYEYYCWLVEFARNKRYQREVSALVNRIRQKEISYSLVAMQLQADYQIRDSLNYSNLDVFLKEVFRSFADHAAPERELVLKIHPLDNGAERWGKRISDLAVLHNIAGRVHVIKGGDLTELLTNSSGVVLVNSTVAVHALRLNVPICVMGSAVFDIEGLNHTGGLDTFWENPKLADQKFFLEFLSALTTIQVKGSFFNPAGRLVAIGEICSRFRLENEIWRLPTKID